LGAVRCRLRDRAYRSAVAPFAPGHDELAKYGRAKCSPPQYPARKSKNIRLRPTLPP
jgi:hypothetical protein